MNPLYEESDSLLYYDSWSFFSLLVGLLPRDISLQIRRVQSAITYQFKTTKYFIYKCSIFDKLTSEIDLNQYFHNGTQIIFQISHSQMSKIFLLLLLFLLLNQAELLLSEVEKAFIQKQVYHLGLVQTHNKQQKYQKKVSSSWMKYLDDNLKVSQVSIPATHDTGTFRCTTQMDCSTYQCQSWSIYKQLNNGIRYFDLRVNSGLPLTIGHQVVTFMRFSQVLIDTKRFLNQNPSQFLIFAFQRNMGDTDPNEDIQKQFMKYNLSIVYLTHQNMPRVGDLRGKIWVYSGLGIHFNENTFVMNGVMGITDTESIYLQNFWEVYPQNVTEKTKYANQTAFEVSCSKQRMKVNFLSGSVGIAPLQLAKHQEGPNHVILQNLYNNPYVCLGVTLMDFPEVKLIKAIVKSNFLVPPQQL